MLLYIAIIYIYNYVLLCITMHYYVLLYITILLDYVSICCYIVYTKHIVQISVGLHTHSHLAQKRAAHCSVGSLWYRLGLHGSVPRFIQCREPWPHCCGAAVGAGLQDIEKGFLLVEGEVDPGGRGGDPRLRSWGTLRNSGIGCWRWQPRRWRIWSRQYKDYKTRFNNSRRRTSC